MQDIFSKGMERWFATKGFLVGTPSEEIDKSFSLEDLISKAGDLRSRAGDYRKLFTSIGGALGVASRLLPYVSKLGALAGRAGSLIGRLRGVAGTASTVIELLDFLIETKTTAPEFYDALKPYTSKSDLVGLKLSEARVPSRPREDPENKTFWATVLVPVIYADELAPASIMQRFDEFLQASDSLKQLGLRARFVGNRARIYPLLVYFDRKKLEEDGETLWPHIFEESEKEGLRPRTLSRKPSWAEFKTYLSAGVVNVPGKRAISDVFNEDDLHSILEWGQAGNDNLVLGSDPP
jgi:hypothetical protein